MVDLVKKLEKDVIQLKVKDMNFIRNDQINKIKL